MIVAGIPVPPTERERLIIRINRAAYESRTSSVEIRIGGDLDPIVVCSRDESGMGPLTMRHFTVVMPMRI